MGLGRLKKGDLVAWRSSGGESVGRVIRKLTRPMKIQGRKVAASQGRPEYLVRSETSGRLAAHKARALKPLP